MVSLVFLSGIGRCRHSSNFSNRQTPANTNSLNSGSGSHGSHSNPQQTKGHTCNCNLKKPKTPGSILAANWPFNKLKKIFLEYKDSGELGKCCFLPFMFHFAFFLNSVSPIIMNIYFSTFSSMKKCS